MVDVRVMETTTLLVVAVVVGMSWVDVRVDGKGSKPRSIKLNKINAMSASVSVAVKVTQRLMLAQNKVKSF